MPFSPCDPQGLPPSPRRQADCTPYANVNVRNPSFLSSRSLRLLFFGYLSLPILWRFVFAPAGHRAIFARRFDNAAILSRVFHRFIPLFVGQFRRLFRKFAHAVIQATFRDVQSVRQFLQRHRGVFRRNSISSRSGAGRFLSSPAATSFSIAITCFTAAVAVLSAFEEEQFAARFT